MSGALAFGCSFCFVGKAAQYQHLVQDADVVVPDAEQAAFGFGLLAEGFDAGADVAGFAHLDGQGGDFVYLHGWSP